MTHENYVKFKFNKIVLEHSHTIHWPLVCDYVHVRWCPLEGLCYGLSVCVPPKCTQPRTSKTSSTDHLVFCRKSLLSLS